MTVPVLTDETTRKNYDRTWSLFPFEHPGAYWLRAGAFGIICTRCGREQPAECGDGDNDFQAFTTVHLSCPSGNGFGKAAKDDPLFRV